MRKKIGLFIDHMSNAAFQQQLFYGLQKAIGGKGYQLYVFNGGSAVEGPDESLNELNTAYELFDPKAFDGLLVSSTLGSYTTPEKFEKFLKGFSPVPVVVLGAGPDNVPCVTVDNKAGMEELINHFIHEHGYRKIAFITGTRGHKDAEERLETYRNCLRKADIPYDERYVVDGYFVTSSGANGVKTLFDERGLEVEAIICSNDHEAIGASNELDAKGKAVPHDCALSGFDDIELASSLFPGLTTVNQSLDALCVKALSLLDDLIAGKRVPMHSLSPARLVVRSTCGCTIDVAERSGLRDAKRDASLSWQELRGDCSRSIVQTLASLDLDIDQATVTGFLDGLYAEVHDGETGVFLPKFEKYLRGLFYAGRNLIPVQDVLSECKSAMFPLIGDVAKVRILEDLIHHARLIVEEVEIIRKNKELQELEKRYNLIIAVGNSVSHALNFEELHNSLKDNVPKTGIQDFVLALYAGDDTKNAEVKTLIRGGTVSDKTYPSFPSRSLLPSGLTFDSEVLFVCPIYTQDNVMGYIVSSHIAQADFIIWNLLLNLNRSLLTLFLVKQIRDTEEQIRRNSEQIETLVKPMIETIGRVRDISDDQSKTANGINNISLENAAKVKDIFKQADGLQKILKETNVLVDSIDDISERINIVALNASIQAAHAGTYGKGFSVIAAEVRKLSQSTGTNVKQINTFLQTIRSGFEGFLGVNRETGAVLLDLSERISTLTKSLEEVSQNMDDMSHSSNEILALMK